MLKKLDVPKEMIDSECEIFENYKRMYEDLNQISDMKTSFDELHDLKKNIQAMSSNCVGNGEPIKVSFDIIINHNLL